ncbi:hypothetical protein [Porphyromonas pogonae]|uniref:hypothetical protein n=1 Tax=Porphyromonas pogonae TaxID=867595 RepID=UPI002E75C5AA|nr:hypothetical protein [Porphyromonas pogonae]
MKILKSNFTSLVIILIVACTLITLPSCGSTASLNGGLSDEAYIVVVSNKQYVNKDVYIVIDDKPAIKVKAVKEKDAVRKGERIVILPGTHKVVVLNDHTQEMYSKNLFISSRSSRTVVLP